uniref:Uncharacterized protein n=1 Tax=Coccidioides posadasii RMSCC 3488 TaxID=454284 RepID=A0A0J6FK35_COCPO|nr:hypothetical protein CPAG_06989 [Coccidioides posadasii RMSCC 3488]
MNIAKSISKGHPLLALARGTRTLNREELLNHLAHIYKKHRNIGSVKTDDSTYLWFRLANRPARAEDALGIYEFKHQPITLVANMKTFDFNRYARITGVNKFTTVNLQKEWETTGSVVIPQLMRWWNDKLQAATTTVLTRVNGEYDMYYHHQRMMGGRGGPFCMDHGLHGVVEGLKFGHRQACK